MNPINIEKKFNDIHIYRSTSNVKITIQCKQSRHHGNIVLNIFVLVLFWLFGFFTLYSMFNQSNAGDFFFLILWLSLLFFMSFRTVEHILWLKKGEEVIEIDQTNINIIKKIPSYYFQRHYIESHIVKMIEIKKIYFSEHIPFRNQLPSSSKGNCHLKTSSTKISFGINLSQKEAQQVLNEIQKFKKMD